MNNVNNVTLVFWIFQKFVNSCGTTVYVDFQPIFRQFFGEKSGILLDFLDVRIPRVFTVEKLQLLCICNSIASVSVWYNVAIVEVCQIAL